MATGLSIPGTPTAQVTERLATEFPAAAGGNGTVVLHTAPEAAAGGPLALVENGDMIDLDVKARRLHLDVPEAELERRRRGWRPPQPPMLTGYQRLYFDHVLQANEGADLDFLVGRRGAAVGRHSH